MSSDRDPGAPPTELDIDQRAAAWEQFSARVESRTAVIGVLGLGYVGLPLAVELARSGYHVLGFDISEALVGSLNRGESHIQDVPSEVLGTFVSGGMFEATY